VRIKNLEKLATTMLRKLKIVGQKHAEDVALENAESVRIKVHAGALTHLTKQTD